MNRQLNRIMWAVDVFEPKENHLKALSLLRSLVAKTNSEVEIVHILTFAYTPPKHTNAPSWGEALQVLAEKKMDELAKSSEIPRVKTTILSVASGSSTRINVELLLKHANTISANAILVATHARKGIPRLVLGSFAETLLLQSKVPILTLNPDAHPTQKIASILFPTFFTPVSHASFESVVILAKSLEARLVLYYKEPLLVSSTYVMPPAMFDYMAKELETRKQVAYKWQAEADRQGVTTSVVLDETPGNPTLAITEYAVNNSIDLVTMVTHADTVSALLIGSTSRQVVRQVQCPVFVMRESV